MKQFVVEMSGGREKRVQAYAVVITHTGDLVFRSQEDKIIAAVQSDCWVSVTTAPQVPQ